MICNCLLNEFELWMCYKILCSGLFWSVLGAEQNLQV